MRIDINNRTVVLSHQLMGRGRKHNEKMPGAVTLEIACYHDLMAVWFQCALRKNGHGRCGKFANPWQYGENHQIQKELEAQGKLWRLHHSTVFAPSSGLWCYACTRNKCTHTKTTMLWLAQLLMYFTSYQVCSGSCFPIAETVIAVSFSIKDALIEPP